MWFFEDIRMLNIRYEVQVIVQRMPRLMLNISNNDIISK